MAFEPDNSAEKPSKALFLRLVIRKIFLEDWAMKLAAIAITFTLWLGVTGLSKTASERYTVPLNLRIADDAIITNSPMQDVEIKLSGDDRRIQQVKKSDLSISVDLSDVPPGDKVVTLTPDNVFFPALPGIKLDEIQPNKIAVKIERLDEREIPVKIEAEGEVPEGYEIYSETVQPQRVRVRGPQGFIRSLTSVGTERIDLTNRREDFTAKQVPLILSNPKTTLFDTFADVTFRIGEKRVERIFLVPVTDNATKKVAVVLFGARSLFDNIRPHDLQVEMEKDENGQEIPKVLLPAQLQNKVEIRKPKAN